MNRKDVTNLFVRFLVTFACCLPVLIPLGFLLSGKVLDIVMIIIFVLVAGIVFALEEYIHLKIVLRRNQQKKQRDGSNFAEEVRQEELKMQAKRERKQQRKKKN